MFSILKKAALVGIGFSERAKELVEELAKKGEENQSNEALKIKAFLDSAEKGGRELNQKVEDLCKKVSDKIKFPTQADIERLEKELAELAARLRRPEGAQPETK
jgi:polyhydroxyalkanoate synthesis regulator phasin